MGFIVEDGTGKGFKWKISKDNKGEVNAVTLTEEQAITTIYEATGIDTTTITSARTLLYIHNVQAVF